MAEIETSFVTHAKTQSVITAYTGQRVYELSIPDVARKPFIVVRPTTNERAAWTQTQYGGTARLSIYCHAETASKARDIGAVVMSTYKQFAGTLADHTVQFVEVSTARLLYGGNKDYRYLVDLVVHYT